MISVSREGLFGKKGDLPLGVGWGAGGAVYT